MLDAKCDGCCNRSIQAREAKCLQGHGGVTRHISTATNWGRDKMHRRRPLRIATTTTTIIITITITTTIIIIIITTITITTVIAARYRTLWGPLRLSAVPVMIPVMVPVAARHRRFAVRIAFTLTACNSVHSCRRLCRCTVVLAPASASAFISVSSFAFVSLCSAESRPAPPPQCKHERKGHRPRLVERVLFPLTCRATCQGGRERAKSGNGVGMEWGVRVPMSL